jgi:hypothetical protein
LRKEARMEFRIEDAERNGIAGSGVGFVNGHMA